MGIDSDEVIRMKRLRALVSLAQLDLKNKVDEDFMQVHPDELSAAKQHTQRIAQNATTVYNYVMELLRKGQMNINAQQHAQDLRNTANHMQGLLMSSTPDWNAFEVDVRNLTGPREVTNRVESSENERYAFLALREHYFTAEWIERFNYRPMKEIQDSLEYLQQFLEKKRRIE